MFSSHTFRKKIKILLMLFLVSILFFIFINQTESQAGDNVETSKFNTVILYEAFDEFMYKARNNQENLGRLYEEIILSHIESDLGLGAAQILNTPIRNFNDLETQLSLFKEQDVEKIVLDVLQEIEGFLPATDTTLYIFPSTAEYQPITSLLGGAAGWTMGPGKILILLDPSSENWESLLPYLIAHEYHHSVSFAQKNFNGKMTLLDYLVFEGKADSFAHMLYPNAKAPWTSSINREVEKKLWGSIENDLDSQDDELLFKVMFGDYGAFPHWGGYTIGYHIVQEFLKCNTDLSIEEWTMMSSKEILNKSGYGTCSFWEAKLKNEK